MTSASLKLNDDAIRRLVGDTIFARGWDYFRHGAVGRVVARGNLVSAEVAGSEEQPYQVQIAFDAEGIASTDCTCPYWDTCKHVAATLLTLLHRSELVEIRPPLPELLAPLDRKQLTTLLLRLAEQPGVADAIDDAMAAQAPRSARKAAARRLPAPNVEATRRQMRELLDRDTYDDYGGSYQLVDGVLALIDQAHQRSDAGDSAGALALLSVIGDEFFERWYEVDEDGELTDAIDEIGEAVAEALLSIDLPRDERAAWEDALNDWYDTAAEYGAANGLALAVAAVKQSWDYEPLRQVLAGEIGPHGAWAGTPPPYADRLGRLRLRILERQGRLREYVLLAEAEGLVVEYAVMLARTGQVDAAVRVALDEFQTGDEALALAEVLRAQGAMDAALRIAEHGLSLREPLAPLARWLTAFAQERGVPGVALRAAQQAFRSKPSLDAYGHVEQLAGEGWPALKGQLLKQLKRADNWLYSAAKVDVFLHEGLLDDAIAVVKSGMPHTLLERVMDAVVGERPEWVLTAALKEAERIVTAEDAQHYQQAVSWLRRARDAYRVLGNEAGWREYLDNLRAAHGRKYKLMGLLPQLEH